MVFYAALYEDGFLWFVREEAEALSKFREEDAGSVTLVRMKGNIDIQPGNMTAIVLAMTLFVTCIVNA